MSDETNNCCLFCGEEMDDNHKDFCSEECEEAHKEEYEIESARMENFYWRQKMGSYL